MLEKMISEIRNEPIVLAHHPLCGKYDDHFFTIRGKKVCRGCLVVYPTAVLVAPFLFMLDDLTFTTLFSVSIILFLLNLARLVIRRGEITNIIFNVILGACLSTTIFSATKCPEDAVYLFYPFVFGVYMIFMSYRGLKMVNGCKKCSNYSRFPACCTHEHD